jgi:CDP-4-dehydro-6-deoxyglucose reductase
MKNAGTVRVIGPQGDFVLDEKSRRSLVFIAWESGFPPIKSLIEHALALEVAESLWLYWIAADGCGRYCDNVCRAWSDALDNFRYVPLTLRTGAPDNGAMQDALERIVQFHPRLDVHDIYVAGPQVLTDAAIRLLPERGLPRAQLFVDALEAT